MMWVTIVIKILVLLMILVLKMTNKYHITWYWCQNMRDNMVEKRVKKFGHGSPPPFSGNARKKSFFFRRASLSHTPWYCSYKWFGTNWLKSRPLDIWWWQCHSHCVTPQCILSNTCSFGHLLLIHSSIDSHSHWKTPMPRHSIRLNVPKASL